MDVEASTPALGTLPGNLIGAPGGSSPRPSSNPANVQKEMRAVRGLGGCWVVSEAGGGVGGSRDTGVKNAAVAPQSRRTKKTGSNHNTQWMTDRESVARQETHFLCLFSQFLSFLDINQFV